MSTPPEEGRIALIDMGFEWDSGGNARWFYRSTPTTATQKVYWGGGCWQAACGEHYGAAFDTPEAAVLDAELNGWWS